MLMTVIYLTEALLVISKKSGLCVKADKNSTWSCLEIRMQNEFKRYSLIETVKRIKILERN